MIKARIGTLGCLLFFSGCGYAVRTSQNPMLASRGIRRVYIETVQNKTFKAGADIQLQSALEKMIRTQAQVIVVRSRDDADAILKTDVLAARFGASASTTGDRLQPTSIGAQFGTYTVATVYSAVLSCSVSLVPRGDLKPLWSSEFTRTKSFPGSNQLGVYGTTSSLINESEFERALVDLSGQVALDVHESLLGVF